MAPRTLVLTLALLLAVTSAAIAAPLKGKTYKGSISKFGRDSEHHKVPIPAHSISLKVSANGKKVSVRVSFGRPLMYCQSSEQIHYQTTSPAKISANGSFHASIAERFKNSVGGAPITQIISGRFSGHTVKGTIRTTAEGETFCEGTTTFSAHA